MIAVHAPESVTESASGRWLRLGSPASVLVIVAVFVLALCPRLVELERTITSDEGYWMQRTLRFGAALSRGDFLSTYRSGHPGVTTMWVGLLGVGPERLETLKSPDLINHVRLERHPLYLETLMAARRAMVVAGAALISLVALLTWRLLGPGPALVGGSLLALDPYLVGSAQLLHVDTLLPTIMLAGLLTGLIFWLGGSQRRYLVLCGIFIGLAVLTKAPGVALPLYVSVIALVVARPWRRGWRSLTPLFVSGAIAAIVCFVLWPTLWVDPARRLGQVITFAITIGGQPHNWPNFFLGRPETGNPGPLYYPLALAFRLSPVVIVGLILAALAYRPTLDRGRSTLALVGFSLFFIALMTVGAKKFDRYLLPAIVVLNLVGGAGFWWAARGLAQPLARALLSGLVLAAQVILFWSVQPYPLASYNPLVGGVEGASRVIIVGWGEGMEQVANYLNAQPNAERLVAKAHYHHVLRPRFKGSTTRLPDPASVDYFVLYINMVQRQITPAVMQGIMAERPPDFTATVNGTPYAWVYRVDRQVQPDPGQTFEEDEE